MWHSITSKLKAAFSPQMKERLSSLDLLTAEVRHKDTAPSFAITSIALLGELSNDFS